MDWRLRTYFTLCVACCFLAACGDPLAKVDKLSSVELAEDVGTVGALPDPAETARQGGLFSGLFNRNAAPAPVAQVAAEPTHQAQTDAAVGAALGVATGEMPKNQDVSLVAQPVVTTPVATPKRRGLFGFMRAKEAAQPTVAVAPIVAAAPQETIEASVAVEPEKLAEITQTAPAAVQKPRRGLFGLLSGARAKAKDTPAQSAPEEVNVRTAALGPVVAPKKKANKNSLFAKRKHKGPDAQIVPFGTRLPPGVVARVCDLPRGRLGKEVEKFPERGRGYTMIDSEPGSSSARPFYVAGFDDKCARTFTAALALFGSPTMHEQLRYGLPSKVQPYSTTDKAYEGIKRSVCGVGKKKSCGAKINKLEKNTVFISVYDRIGSNAQWSNILVHDGWVLATDRKG